MLQWQQIKILDQRISAGCLHQGKTNVFIFKMLRVLKHMFSPRVFLCGDDIFFCLLRCELSADSSYLPQACDKLQTRNSLQV